ncbi:MAG: hypothetical protein WKF57_06020 [Nakamurella sp.]
MSSPQPISVPVLAAPVLSVPAESTRDRLAAHDGAMQAEAAHLGHPLERMMQPGALRRISVDPSAVDVTFFWERSGKLVCAEAGSPVRKATPGDVVRSLSVGGTCSPVNRVVATKLAGLLKSALPSADALIKPTLMASLRMIRFATGATASSRLVVLTDALANKFYLPTSTRPAILTSWVKAFGLSVSPTDPAHTMAILLAKVWDSPLITNDLTGTGAENPWRAALKSEETAESAFVYGGAGDQSTQFGAATAISEAWGAIERVDPLLRHRCVVAGSVTRIRAVRRHGVTIIADAITAPRVKEGGIMVTAADHVGYGKTALELLAYTADQTGISMVLAESTAKSYSGVTKRGGFTALVDSLNNKYDLMVSAEPFLAAARKIHPGRWGAPSLPETERIVRDVPLHVMLAGA